MATKAKTKGAGPRGAQVKEIRKITDASLARLVKQIQPNLNLKAEALTKGQRVARGQRTTASASDTVVTGLTTVAAVVAVLDDDPVAGCAVVTASIGNQAGAPAAGSVLIKTWNTTFAAATTFGKKVNWIAWGT